MKILNIILESVTLITAELNRLSEVKLVTKSLELETTSTY